MFWYFFLYIYLVLIAGVCSNLLGVNSGDLYFLLVGLLVGVVVFHVEQEFLILFLRS